MEIIHIWRNHNYHIGVFYLIYCLSSDFRYIFFVFDPDKVVFDFPCVCIICIVFDSPYVYLYLNEKIYKIFVLDKMNVNVLYI